MLLRLVTVHGESMWPALVPERRYLVTGLLRPRTGDIVLAQTGDGLVVKRVTRIADGVVSLAGTVSWSSRYEVPQGAVRGILLRSRLRTV